MTRYREHWNPAHPAVRAWINEHPEQRYTIRYRRAMVRHRLGQQPTRNRDRLRAVTGIACLLAALPVAGSAVSFLMFAAGVGILWPFFTEAGQA